MIKEIIKLVVFTSLALIKVEMRELPKSKEEKIGVLIAMIVIVALKFISACIAVMSLINIVKCIVG